MPSIPTVVVATGIAGATAVTAGIAYLKQLGENAAIIAAQNGITDPGEVDTFRHTYTSAELTRLTGSEGLVKILGDMNEIGSVPNWTNGIPGVRDRNGDLLNNKSGRGIGKNSTSQQDSIDKVIAALRRGDLVTKPQVDPDTDPVNFPPDLIPFPFPDSVELPIPYKDNNQNQCTPTDTNGNGIPDIFELPYDIGARQDSCRLSHAANG